MILEYLENILFRIWKKYFFNSDRYSVKSHRSWRGYKNGEE